MDANFWNARYKEPEYAYGKEPNDFLRSVSYRLKPNSTVLCLAEGEGRNAVYLAENNHYVIAVDYSQEGLNKLTELAREKKLSIYGGYLERYNSIIREKARKSPKTLIKSEILKGNLSYLEKCI